MKKLISLILLACFVLTGCDISELEKLNIETSNPDNSQTEELPVEYIDANIGFNEFDSDLIFYLTQHNKDENYMVSPLSFKYALGLATIGAGGDTEKELLDVVGFESVDEYKNLHIDMQKALNAFKNNQDSTLSILNSVWSVNKIKEEYKENVNSILGDTEINSVTSEEIIPKVNSWVNENTNGLIPNLIETTVANTVLVNTLYLKTQWQEAFNNSVEYNEFILKDGTKTDRKFIEKTAKYNFYKDDDSTLVVIPLDCKINAVFVIGNNSNILEKIDKAEKKDVKVVLPEIELETSFNNNELLDFLRIKGVDIALSRNADFSKIGDFYIDEIIQKTKLIMDKNGIEAAAATAFVSKGMNILSEEPEAFIANQPFEFYIYSDATEIPELMFYGQIVK